MRLSRYSHRFLLLTIVAAAVAPFVLYGVFGAMQLRVTDPIDWVSSDFPSREQYDRFQEQFGTGQSIVISWPGCTLENERVDLLAEHLRADPELFADDGRAYVGQIVSGREIFQTLLDEPLVVPRAEALNRLEGTLVGRDRSTTCLIACLSPAGEAARDEVVERLVEIIGRQTGLGRSEFHLAGETMWSYHIAQATRRSLVFDAAVSAGATLLAATIFLGSFRLAMVVFLIAGYCDGLLLAAIYYSGHQLNSILIVMPPLVLVLGVSGGIHLVNYFFAAEPSRPPCRAAARALAIGRLPCVLSAGTTAIGLASLAVSRLEPVRTFGVYAAVGVLLSLVLLLGALPGGCEWVVQRTRDKNAHWGGLLAGTVGKHGRIDPIPLLRRWAWVIATGGIALIVLAIASVPSVQTSIQPETLFGEDSTGLIDHRWIDRNVGALVPLDVVVRFDADTPVPFHQRLQLIERIEQAVAELPETGGTMSAMTFLPKINWGGRFGSVVRRHVIASLLERHRDELTRMSYLSERDGVQRWRINARVRLPDGMTQRELFADVQGPIDQIQTEILAEHTDAVSVDIRGVGPLVDQIQSSLLTDLFKSFFWALVLITAVMIFAQRSVVFGLVAMVPNIFPVAIMFGGLGWAGVPIDIGTVMTASLALGMAIDGTQHFVTFFRLGLRHGLSVEQSVIDAYAHCHKAILESALVCGLGLAVFIFSDFKPVAQFSRILCLSLTAMVIGDLILLPCLLIVFGRLAAFGRDR